jgi:hypothetical protein
MEQHKQIYQRMQKDIFYLQEERKCQNARESNHGVILSLIPLSSQELAEKVNPQMLFALT